MEIRYVLHFDNQSENEIAINTPALTALFFLQFDTILLTFVFSVLSQVSILLAIELIWNLCEVLFIDAAPGQSDLCD